MKWRLFLMIARLDEAAINLFEVLRRGTLNCCPNLKFIKELRCSIVVYKGPFVY